MAQIRRVTWTAAALLPLLALAVIVWTTVESRGALEGGASSASQAEGRPGGADRRLEALVTGVGASDYQAIGDPRVDIAAFAARLAGLGLRHTRVWLIDAWATGTGETGTYEGFLPVEAPEGGAPWDLHAWRDDYFDRVRQFALEMNAQGIVPVFTLLELYAWSENKEGLLWVPDRNRGPWRHNVNGVKWGEPDARTFEALPDDWLREFSRRILAALDGTTFVIEVGNEMPNRAMHGRIVAMLREQGYEGPFQVSPHTDAPGAWRDWMGDDTFRWLAIHGRERPDYLEEQFPSSRSPVATYREMWTEADPSRIVLSSDGARKSTNVDDAYDYEGLRAVASDALGRGAAYEHQLSVKLRRFTHGEYRLDDMRYDEPFLRALTGK